MNSLDNVIDTERARAPHVSRGATNASVATCSRSRLWLWFVAAFLVQVAVWTTWFVIAAHHHVEEVPLAFSEHTPAKAPGRAGAGS